MRAFAMPLRLRQPILRPDGGPAAMQGFRLTSPPEGCHARFRWPFPIKTWSTGLGGQD